MDERLVADLEAAKALIADPANWRKETGDTDGAPCCAIVATNRVLRARGVGEPYARHVYAWRALADALPDQWEPQRLYGPGYVVGEFNDDPATTHADVLALFDRAIAFAKAA